MSHYTLTLQDHDDKSIIALTQQKTDDWSEEYEWADEDSLADLFFQILIAKGYDKPQQTAIFTYLLSKILPGYSWNDNAEENHPLLNIFTNAFETWGMRSWENTRHIALGLPQECTDRKIELNKLEAEKDGLWRVLEHLIAGNLARKAENDAEKDKRTK